MTAQEIDTGDKHLHIRKGIDTPIGVVVLQRATGPQTEAVIRALRQLGEVSVRYCAPVLHPRGKASSILARLGRVAKLMVRALSLGLGFFYPPLVKASPNGPVTRTVFSLRRGLHRLVFTHPALPGLERWESFDPEALNTADLVVLSNPDDRDIEHLEAARLSSRAFPAVSLLDTAEISKARWQPEKRQMLAFDTSDAPERIARTLLDRARSSPSPVHSADIVLVMADDFLLLEPAGNATVLDRQLKYLTDRGERIVLAYLNASQGAPRSRFFLDVQRRYPLAGVIDVNLRAYGDRHSYDPWYDTHGLGNFGELVDRYRHLTPHPDLVSLTREGRIKYAIVNYCWTLQLIAALPGSFPVICETHDIQSRQWAVQTEKDVHPGDMRVELELLSQADALIAISETEAAFLRSELEPSRVHYNVGGFEIRVRAEKPDVPASLPDAWHAAGAETPVPAGLENQKLDLFFVGHSNFHNANALAWFVEEIMPQLPKPATLVVAGAVSNMASLKNLANRDTVHFIGIVDDLTPLYEGCTVVTVPLKSGEGTSIKTVEAMSFGKAIATTSVGLRGLGDIDYPRADTTQEFSNFLGRLLADETYRRDLEAKSEKIAASFSTKAYFNRFDEIVHVAKTAFVGRGSKK